MLIYHYLLLSAHVCRLQSSNRLYIKIYKSIITVTFEIIFAEFYYINAYLKMISRKKNHLENVYASTLQNVGMPNTLYAINLIANWLVS